MVQFNKVKVCIILCKEESEQESIGESITNLLKSQKTRRNKGLDRSQMQSDIDQLGKSVSSDTRTKERELVFGLVD